MNISWTIKSLECLPSIDGKEKVVSKVHYALEGELDGVYEEVLGFVELPEPTDSFTEFSKLTKEEVVSWVESHVDVELITEELGVKIALKASAPIFPELPFNN